MIHERQAICQDCGGSWFNCAEEHRICSYPLCYYAICTKIQRFDDYRMSGLCDYHQQEVIEELKATDAGL